MPVYRPKKSGVKSAHTVVAPVHIPSFDTDMSSDSKPHLYYRSVDRDGLTRFYCTSMPRHLQVAFVSYIDQKFTVKRDDSPEFCFSIWPKQTAGPIVDAYEDETRKKFVIEIFKHLINNKPLLEQVKVVEAKGAAPAY